MSLALRQRATIPSAHSLDTRLPLRQPMHLDLTDRALDLPIGASLWPTAIWQGSSGIAIRLRGRVRETGQAGERVHARRNGCEGGAWTVRRGVVFQSGATR